MCNTFDYVHINSALGFKPRSQHVAEVGPEIVTVLPMFQYASFKMMTFWDRWLKFTVVTTKGEENENKKEVKY